MCRSSAILLTIYSGKRFLVVVDDYDIASLIRHALHSERWQLIDRVWPGVDKLGARTVDVHVGRLRVKLGKVGEQIGTVFGVV